MLLKIKKIEIIRRLTIGSLICVALALGGVTGCSNSNNKDADPGPDASDGSSWNGFVWDQGKWD